jgi:hypothetical protein
LRSDQSTRQGLGSWAAAVRRHQTHLADAFALAQAHRRGTLRAIVVGHSLQQQAGGPREFARQQLQHVRGQP